MRIAGLSCSSARRSAQVCWPGGTTTTRRMGFVPRSALRVPRSGDSPSSPPASGRLLARDIQHALPARPPTPPRLAGAASTSQSPARPRSRPPSLVPVRWPRSRYPPARDQTPRSRWESSPSPVVSRIDFRNRSSGAAVSVEIPPASPGPTTTLPTPLPALSAGPSRAKGPPSVLRVSPMPHNRGTCPPIVLSPPARPTHKDSPHFRHGRMIQTARHLLVQRAG